MDAWFKQICAVLQLSLEKKYQQIMTHNTSSNSNRYEGMEKKIMETLGLGFRVLLRVSGLICPQNASAGQRGRCCKGWMCG